MFSFHELRPLKVLLSRFTSTGQRATVSLLKKGVSLNDPHFKVTVQMEKLLDSYEVMYHIVKAIFILLFT